MDTQATKDTGEQKQQTRMSYPRLSSGIRCEISSPLEALGDDRCYRVNTILFWNGKKQGFGR